MEERTISSTRAWQGHVVAVRVDEIERADGRRATRDVVEHPGAVAILAWDGERLAMVRQWRHATGQALLEIPAGTLEPDEPPAETAKRELGEECGLAAATWAEGPRFYTAPGFCTELMHVYLATDLTDAPSIADEDEVLEPSWMALPDALEAIEDGRIIDGKSVASILWLDRRVAGPAT